MAEKSLPPRKRSSDPVRTKPQSAKRVSKPEKRNKKRGPNYVLLGSVLGCLLLVGIGLIVFTRQPSSSRTGASQAGQIAGVNSSSSAEEIMKSVDSIMSGLPEQLETFSSDPGKYSGRDPFDEVNQQLIQLERQAFQLAPVPQKEVVALKDTHKSYWKPEAVKRFEQSRKKYFDSLKSNSPDNFLTISMPIASNADRMMSHVSEIQLALMACPEAENSSEEQAVEIGNRLRGICQEMALAASKDDRQKANQIFNELPTQLASMKEALQKPKSCANFIAYYHNLLNYLGKEGERLKVPNATDITEGFVTQAYSVLKEKQSKQQSE